MTEEEIQNECNRLVKLMEDRGYSICHLNCEFITNSERRFYLSTKEKMFPGNNNYLFVHADDCSTGFAKCLAAIMALPTAEEQRALDLAQKMAAAREAAVAFGADPSIISMFEKLNEELWKNALPAPSTERLTQFKDAVDADEIPF